MITTSQCICSMHTIVTIALPYTHATGEAIPRRPSVHYTTAHSLTDIDWPAATTRKQAVNVTDNAMGNVTFQS